MENSKQLQSQYINGKWRNGSSETTMPNLNPYNNELIATYQAASIEDLDEAYESAAQVQTTWQKENPVSKRAVFEKAVQLIEKNHEDIVNIITEEIGGTRLKAEFEIGLVTNIIKEAATFPFRMEGKILPSPTDGKENRIYRIPVGVVGVISPFNFPFF